MEDKVKGCVASAKGPLLPPKGEEILTKDIVREEVMIKARVGKEAPDFEAIAFIGGEFKVLRFSDFRGKWVVLCFYPGDFTFV